MSSSESSSRAQVGIESLVVFVGMALVAAMAAGLLVSTAGTLQNEATETSFEAQGEVSDRVTVLSATGTVNGSAETIDSISLYLMQAPGSGDVDLNESTIQWIGPDGATTLTDGEFSVSGVKDDDNSVPVLNARDDRFAVSISLDESNEVRRPLAAGESVTLRVVGSAGTRTTVVLTVPASLSSAGDGEAVAL